METGLDFIRSICCTSVYIIEQDFHFHEFVLNHGTELTKQNTRRARLHTVSTQVEILKVALTSSQILRICVLEYEILLSHRGKAREQHTGESPQRTGPCCSPVQIFIINVQRCIEDHVFHLLLVLWHIQGLSACTQVCSLLVSRQHFQASDPCKSTS